MARLLQSWGVVLVDCEIRETTITAGICVVDPDEPPPKSATLIDPDTGERYAVTLPELTSPVSYRLELERAAL